MLKIYISETAAPICTKFETYVWLVSMKRRNTISGLLSPGGAIGAALNMKIHFPNVNVQKNLHTHQDFQNISYSTVVHISACRWRYNQGKRVLASIFATVHPTFKYFISSCSRDSFESADISSAHFCESFFLLHRKMCRTYFYKLLLGFWTDLHQTWHTPSRE